MAVDDRTRLNLHRKLEAVLGPDDAATLMAHLPPVTWNQVATRADVDNAVAVFRSELSRQVAELRTELHDGLADVRNELRTELADVRTELRTELADVRTELRTGLAHVRTDVTSAIDRQTRWMVTAMIAWTSIALAVAGFVL